MTELRERRRALGWRRKDVAEMLGVTPGWVSRMEREPEHAQRLVALYQNGLTWWEVELRGGGKLRVLAPDRDWAVRLLRRTGRKPIASVRRARPVVIAETTR